VGIHHPGGGGGIVLRISWQHAAPTHLVGIRHPGGRGIVPRNPWQQAAPRTWCASTIRVAAASFGVARGNMPRLRIWWASTIRVAAASCRAARGNMPRLRFRGCRIVATAVLLLAMGGAPCPS